MGLGGDFNVYLWVFLAINSDGVRGSNSGTNEKRLAGREVVESYRAVVGGMNIGFHDQGTIAEAAPPVKMGRLSACLLELYEVRGNIDPDILGRTGTTVGEQELTINLYLIISGVFV